MSGNLRTRGTSGRPWFIPGLAGLFLAAGLAWAGDDPKEKPKGSPDLDPVTREHLGSKVPNFFYYDYPYGPAAGKRLWLRVDDSTFVDRLPDGTEMRFQILGRAKVREADGVIVAKTGGTAGPGTAGFKDDGSFQIFIPDKGSKPMAVLFRHIDGPGLPEWKDMSWSDGRITELQKVE